MTLPNIITILRFVMVPLIIYALINGWMMTAFVSFLIAGISDGVDGFIARRWNQRSELGAYLDPIADKAMLTSAFVGLAWLQIIPVWLTILVVSRDLLIVGGVILASVMTRPIEMKPVFVSKANTAAQIGLVSVALLDAATGLSAKWLADILVATVALLTVASAAAYLVIWLRHMAGDGGQVR